MKDLLLGTAQWGWTVSKADAFRLLDAWLNAGFRELDAATNYPINKRPEDFRASEKILQEYVQAHGLQDLRVTMKIGSLDNLRTPEINLAPSFLLMMAGEYRRLFGNNLSGIMVHWDNRDDEAAIGASLEALAVLAREGLRPGLSGIARPEVYARRLANHEIPLDIELKHNVLQSDLTRYQPLQGHGYRFLAYGINAGGLKLSGQYTPESTWLARGGQPEVFAEKIRQIETQLPRWNTAFVRPPVKTMNHLGLIYAALNPAIHGILLGVSSPEQLTETLDFYRNLDVFDYRDVFETIDFRLQV